MKTDDWIAKYTEKGALWLHDENPARPHALLTSGLHSNGFFNSALVMEDVLLLDEACIELTRLLWANGLALAYVDRVVGPAMGAITIAHELAYHIGTHAMRPCMRSYTEKSGNDLSKQMTFKRTAIKADEKILLCEDVLTTDGSFDLTAKAVTDAGGIVLTFVAVLVNRSGHKEVSDKKIVALIDRPMPMWTPDECPLCKLGSEAIRPKGKENWERLKATY